VENERRVGLPPLVHGMPGFVVERCLQILEFNVGFELDDAHVHLPEQIN
jgi:hypothetical protein